MLVSALALVARAEPLWVEPLRVDEVREAADALWPGGPLEVAPRPVAPADGFLWDGATLAWISGGRAWTEPAEDAATVVLLARAWLTDPPDGGTWVPPAEVALAPPPPPAPPPAPAPEPGGSAFVVGLGLRATYGSLVPDGVRFAAGALGEHLDAELIAFVSTAPRARPSPLEGIVADRFDGEVLTPVDVATLAAWGGWDLGVPRRVPGEWTVAPVLLAGLQLGEVAQRALGRRGVAVEEAHAAEVAGLAGLAAEVWWSTGVGLRASAVDRIARRARLDGSRGLDQRVAVSVDVRVVP